MISTPKLTVVMPAYNAAVYLDDAVTSILNQTFRDFELIIVNDGSTDDTASVLDKYERSDSRIRVYHQENQGMIPALNHGCRLARGKYIARMDADDISFRDRLEKQVSYIEEHPQIGILGTWVCTERDGVVIGSWSPSTSSKVLKWDNFFGVCVAHAAVVMRRDVLERLNFYRHDAVHAEDGDLWLRASAITEFGNVPEVLYKVRAWPGSTSRVGAQSYREAHLRLLFSFIRDLLNVDPPLEAVDGLRRTRVGPPFENLRQIHLTADLIQKLYYKFLEYNSLTPGEKRDISWDAAKRIASMALQAARFDVLEAAPLCMKAVKLNHRLLYPSAMIKGLERAFQG